jgi:hypothetical protein
MAMEKAVLVTNASGLVGFCTTNNSFLIPVESDVDDRGYAKPSAEGLTVLMQQVRSDKPAAQKRAAQARKDMQEKWCPECVGSTIVSRLEEIAAGITLGLSPPKK